MGKSQLGMEQMTRSSTTSQHVLQSTLSEALSSKSPMVAMPVTSRENISKRDTSSIYTEEHRLLKGISLSNHVTAADYTNETRLVDESPTGFSPLLIHEPTVGSIINLAPEKVDAQTLMEPSEDIFYSDESDETTEQIDSSVNPVIFKNKHTFNLVFLNCEPYVLSGEISSILWDSDILETVLQESGINVPSVKMTVRSHPNIYLQLIEFEADVYDNTGKLRPTLTVFLLGALPSILKCFNHYDTDLLLWIQELCDVYDTNFEKMSIKNSISSQATHSGIKKIDQGNAQFNENGYQKQFAYRLLNMQTTAYEDETESIRTASLRNTGDTMLCVKSITPSEIHKCMHLVHKIFGTGDDMAIARESANEDFLIEPDTQDCVDKLIELAKSDERYLGTIETIEMLKRDLPHNPYLKEDLCKLIECIKEIWNRSHPDRKQMNLDGLRQSEQQYENGQISSARYTDENSNMCRNLVPATMKRFQEKPLEELSNLEEIEKEQCFFPVLDKSNCVARKETLPRSTNGKMLLNQTTIPMQYGAGNAGEEIIQKNTWFDEDDQLQRTNHEIVLKRQCDDKILLGKLDITYSSFGNEKTSLENSQWRRQDVLPTNVLGENVPENLHTLQTLEQSYVAKKPPQKFMLRSLRR